MAKLSNNDRALRLVRTIVEHLDPPVSVQLWNGSTIAPSQETAKPELAVRIASAEAVRALVRKPSLLTLIELWCAKQLDVVSGTVFDVAAIEKSAGLKAKIKTLPKRKLARDVPALLFGKASTDTGLSGDNPYVSGSNKDAIGHHYDVSNAFYQLFLDEAMVYTCGYFTDWDNTLDQAQYDKLDLVCRKLRLKPGDHLLDIGCGWGAMLIHAAKHYGATGHGVSLSEAQTELARQRIEAEGLSDKITIEVKSYTDLDMQFDKICSIGMFEHVGLANHATYFAAMNRLLKPGGTYLHHAITRRNKKGKRFGRRTPENRAMIKYIFPGGELDHIGMTLSNLEAHGFEVHDVENLREHYGRTCRLWATRLWDRFDEAIAEVGEPRARLWYFYLAGCAIAFERGTFQINQTVATKRQRGLSILPQTRADLY